MNSKILFTNTTKFDSEGLYAPPELHVSSGSNSSNISSQLPSPHPLEEPHFAFSSNFSSHSDEHTEFNNSSLSHSSRHIVDHSRPAHPYARIQIKNLVNPRHCDASAQACLSKSKIHNGSLQGLEQAVKHGRQMVQHQQKILANSASTKTNTVVQCLVELSALTIEYVWGPLDKNASNDISQQIAIRTYIKELLRRSRVTKSIVQIALIYCLRVSDTVLKLRKLYSTQASATVDPTKPIIPASAAFCGRRMFLGALLCASKYVQDVNFSNWTWANIVGLTAYETALTETTFLKLINYSLFLEDVTFYPVATAILNQSLASPTQAITRRMVEEIYRPEFLNSSQKCNLPSSKSTI